MYFYTMNTTSESAALAQHYPSLHEVFVQAVQVLQHGTPAERQLKGIIEQYKHLIQGFSAKAQADGERIFQLEQKEKVLGEGCRRLQAQVQALQSQLSSTLKSEEAQQPAALVKQYEDECKRQQAIFDRALSRSQQRHEELKRRCARFESQLETLRHTTSKNATDYCARIKALKADRESLQRQVGEFVRKAQSTTTTQVQVKSAKRRRSESGSPHRSRKCATPPSSSSSSTSPQRDRPNSGRHGPRCKYPGCGRRYVNHNELRSHLIRRKHRLTLVPSSKVLHS